MTGSRRLARAVAWAAAALAWTVAAGYLVAIGRFAAADTRCGHVAPRVDMDGGWIVIGTVAVWAAPFVALAVVRRRRGQVVAAAVVLAIALTVVVEMFARPVAFCW